MKRLGEILLERGAIAIAELHTGLEACHYSGGRLGTQLLKFGFVDEHALLEALSEQLNVPTVAAAVLRRAPDTLRRLIPLNVARRLQVVVFDKKEGKLSVAMTTPRSPAAIEEVVSYVGLDITTFVATEVGILTALSEVREAQGEAPSRAADAAFRGADDEWQRLWRPPVLRATDLLQPRRPRNDDQMPMAATFPGLAPVPDSGAVAAVEVLDDETFNKLLRDVDHRDDVGDLLLRRASATLERCYLLAIHSGHIVGWLAKGPGMVVDDVQSFIAPADAPSILSKLNGAESFCGPIPEGQVNDELVKIFGEPKPLDVGVFPILVKNRVVAYLVGDILGYGLPRDDQKRLSAAAQKAGIALEILIMKKKILA
jgi:hypothetical protein